ncbi:MAG TPA: alpha-D-ribose 1-methylphosphonate 5-triphosphate diphosphatase [Candidatus Limiplasma sp.]|nr:alpha-D-ribose 1-methylphosphonate 5-triphosphate diphosphatase [Candidatus Limiplasma sp.]HPS80418.1 alpha-D-ribose 1-methylphosphonate 5-triphosphate diphosphatase [Candidatus Limiplasma sp.]
MIAIQNGKLITPGGVLEGKTLLIDQNRIIGIVDAVANARSTIDATGRYVMPGMVDIHSDKIEQFIQPRPTAQMDFELALKECEREMLLQGITTIYHSISLYRDEFFGKSPLRTVESVQKLASLIGGIHSRDHLIHHRFHLRIEIDNLAAYEIAKAMIQAGLAHEISFMDHTPGQGQYRDLSVYLDTIGKYHGHEIETLGAEGVVEYHRNKPMLSFEQLRELSDLAHAKGVAVASHDDDTADKLAVNRALGVDISEFPVTLETAHAARAMGFHTIVGAPNILMGASHSGNMSAAEAICENCADIVCSDYYPPAMLHGVFAMTRVYGVPLNEMVNRATLNPARAVGIDRDYGSLEVGKTADILLVDVVDGYPVVTDALVDGQITASIAYRR